ncbi:hypothetical protein AKJ37_00675 [candidate division MSBL1 archaeon SCGC-AAA259I09]|uniref:Uncharacterized protein n=1 Tax=candidate division MSBL1 archaeon SCGC-AAA259I09 TaxID=1698267 RepID=A0A133UVQ5_9EURY|nr:hypothetical protein AKJ37_00675 [candidate division MSBL1 archaeon SCGC-AAA259I09]
MNWTYILGYLFGGFILGGLFGTIGGYIPYWRKGLQDQFWQIYNGKPFWIAGGSVVAVIILFGTSVNFLTVIVPIIVAALAMRRKKKKYYRYLYTYP